MKKKTRSFIIVGIFLLVFILIGIYITINKDSVREIMDSFIQRFGFIGIFVFSFFADLLEQPFGPEIPASFGILFNLNFILVIVFSVAGSWIGSLVNFYIGKKYLEPRFEDLEERKVSKKHYRFFNKYGKLGLALAAISPIPWVAFCWLAGIFKMKLRQFILWGLIPRFFRIFGIVLAVFYFKSFFV